MASASVMAQPAMPKPTFQPIIQTQASVSKRKLQDISFDPREHLTYEQPENVIMMEDIGFSADTGVSPVAVSQPFRLFSTECIQKFRDEVLSDQVMQSCLYKSNLAACQLRGYATKYVPSDASRRAISVANSASGTHLSPTTPGTTLKHFPSSPRSLGSISSPT